MKLFTHYVFSAGILLYLTTLLGNVGLYIVSAMWSAVAVNWVIDVFGHDNKPAPSPYKTIPSSWVYPYHPVRAFRTHSVFTAPFIGIIVTVLPVFIGVEAIGQPIFSYLPPLNVALEVLCAFGVISAFSHLFLDSLTEGGIYIIHRFALAHLSYNNFYANTAAGLFGFALIYMWILSIDKVLGAILLI